MAVAGIGTSTPQLMATTELPGIDTEQSFMQNIMTFAGGRRDVILQIWKASGIMPTRLRPEKLEENPYVNEKVMTTQQADMVLNIVVPRELHEAFRRLRGYPEPKLEETIAEEMRKDANLALIADYKHGSAKEGFDFGPLFCFNRQHKMREGRYLQREDCAILPDPKKNLNGIGESELSAVEIGKRTVTTSRAYELIAKLGYAADKDGLSDFLEETSGMLAAHQRLAAQFGPALVAHMYDGGVRLRVRGYYPSKSREEVAEAMGLNQQQLSQVLRQTLVPTHEQAEKAFALFGYTGTDAERDFYAEARRLMRENPEIEPLQPTSPSGAMAHFGKQLKALRVELAIDRRDLPNNVGNLELGKRIGLLSEGQQAQLRFAFGFETENAFDEMADTVRRVQDFRDAHFIPAIEKLLKDGRIAPDNPAAFQQVKHVIDEKIDRGTKFTPQQARALLNQIGMTESECYLESGTGISQQQVARTDEAARFVAEFDRSRYTAHSGGEGSALIGKKSSSRQRTPGRFEGSGR